MLAAVFSILAVSAAISVDRLSYDERWEHFKQSYGKEFADSDQELHRYRAFSENLAKIIRHNTEAATGQHSFTLGLNEYADLPAEEYTKLNGFKVPPAGTLPEGEQFIPTVSRALPDTVDWRREGFVTPVKNQGQCGSCWAFSSTGTLEGQLARKTGNLQSLSEQNLVDCVKTNDGCGGGYMDHSFAYIKKNHGIDTEASYPYKATAGTCRYSKTKIGGYDTGFVDVTPRGDEDALLNAVANEGPIAVAIDASHYSFQLYEKGVYYEPECSSENLDHAVLVVGYGSEDDQDYWLVKNSWGRSWGDEGYIKMARNRNNHCGIATMASYPSV